MHIDWLVDCWHLPSRPVQRVYSCHSVTSQTLNKANPQRVTSLLSRATALPADWLSTGC